MGNSRVRWALATRDVASRKWRREDGIVAVLYLRALFSPMRFITLLLVLCLGAASVASATSARVQCENGSRCDHSVGAQNDSSVTVAGQRRIETGERTRPPAPAVVSDATGDAGLTSVSTASGGTTDSSGLGPWARVLAIVMAAAGALSLIVARMSDA